MELWSCFESGALAGMDRMEGIIDGDRAPASGCGVALLRSQQQSGQTFEARRALTRTQFELRG